MNSHDFDIYCIGNNRRGIFCSFLFRFSFMHSFIHSFTRHIIVFCLFEFSLLLLFQSNRKISHPIGSVCVVHNFKLNQFNSKSFECFQRKQKQTKKTQYILKALLSAHCFPIHTIDFHRHCYEDKCHLHRSNF